MRILYLINSLNGGGAERPLPAVIGLMRACGHSVRVVALARKAGNAIAWLEAAGIDYHIVDDRDPERFASLWQTMAYVRANRPDLLWTSLTRATLFGQLIGRALGIPVASWQHSAFLKPANRFLLRRTRNMSAFWVADSDFVARVTQRQLAVPPERICTWPLFEANAAAPVATPWQGKKDAVFHIGSLGRLEPEKNMELPIRAMAVIRERMPEARIRLSLCGSGSQMAHLKALAAGQGGADINFEGFQPDPLAFCRRLHVYVQPSHFEGLCIAVHEAMQAGLPVIATPVGAIPDIIRDGQSGFLLAPPTPEALAERILHLYTNPGLCARTGQQARAEILERYAKDRIETMARTVIHRAERLVQAWHHSPARGG
ncbi:glycosyltransferase family 4 protein [Komagataeibacter medellinensis]|uniref:Glycosyltransferase n=1 Tax=Komagataeibacter medellinensis (strain NBRC 3288 / BCRC 11682 / LMG 1693 / Kondo 51) TaxID=634177 RepID=G2I4G4_KOMMN|nr:glycosyltransferase family 4 protein [Komagataeibacter medellinensis]BAK83011.1 glycosyltransferase [Komagataeibacter medellinensis NBRC 3288]